jgi:hypothetical protein
VLHSTAEAKRRQFIMATAHSHADAGRIASASAERCPLDLSPVNGPRVHVRHVRGRRKSPLSLGGASVS